MTVQQQMAEYFATRLRAEMLATPEESRYSFVDPDLLLLAIAFLREVK
jgi:hypothetical protein